MIDYLTKPVGKQEKDEIASLISMDSEAFAKFEESYRKSAIVGFFGEPAKNVIANGRVLSDSEMDDLSSYQDIVAELCERIINELVCQYKLLPGPEQYVTQEELQKVPLSIRPQLTGRFMKVDIREPSSVLLLQTAKQCLKTRNLKDQMAIYGTFRCGLDSLDLDSISYQMLGKNKNSIGHWFFQLKDAAEKTGFFKIPETKIIKVPMPILQLSRIEYDEINLPTKHIVNEFCMKAFDLDVTKKYFIKTGVFSSKFDFRNAVVVGEQEVRELGEYLLCVTSIASQMASLLSGRPQYGANTTNEWVVREYIEDTENNPCIYHGMPLHTEYRFFVDFDSDTILGVSPYWRPDIMKKRLGEAYDSNDPDMIHDYIVYCAHENTLMQRYNDHLDQLTKEVKKLIPQVNLSGQWSLDIMQNGNDFYLIDMGLAENSAMRDMVPEALLKKHPIDIMNYLQITDNVAS